MKWYTWLWLVPLCFFATVLDVMIEIFLDIYSLFRKGVEICGKTIGSRLS